MSIISQLASKNYIVVNKTLIKIFGLKEAVLIGELCSEYEYWEKENKLIDDMFFSSMDNIENNTGLSPYEQREAIKSLENCGILRTELKGMPARKYFYIDESQMLKILTSRCEKISQQDVKNFHSNNNKNNNKENNVLSKDNTLQKFEFGKTKKSTKTKQSLWDKCIIMINDFTDDEILRSYLVEFLKKCLENSKEANVPFYSNTFKGKLNNLKKLSDDNYVQREIVLQTLDNGWNGFYALKKDRQNLHDRIHESGAGENIPKGDKQALRKAIEDGTAEKF